MDPARFAERFKRLRSWEDRYRYLIQMGRKLPPFPDEERIDANLVPGCMSRVWMVPDPRDDGTLGFLADSDAHIVKGLIAVLLSVYDGKTPEEILDTDVEGLFEDLELGQHLSANRRNGFYSMNQKIREYARAVAAM
ncbi:MAG: SufE family protein [Gemmatimonadetes bacterium]|nr:MAG: SufE family protein [Gemmatimonadota bacterium]